jgi:hypothetical protein
MFEAPGATLQIFSQKQQHNMTPVVFQELTGETLFKLSLDCLELETVPLWQDIDFVVLKDVLRLNRDGEIVFHNKEILKSAETFLSVLQKIRRRTNFRILVEFKDYYMQSPYVNWFTALDNLIHFAKKYKFDGFKFTFSSDYVLSREITSAFEQILGADEQLQLFTVVEFGEAWLSYRGLVHRLVSVVDYFLFPMQGYFEHHFQNEVHGYKFRKLVALQDRATEVVIAHLHTWVKAGLPLGKMIINFACSGVEMITEMQNNTVVSVAEVSRADIYRKLENGAVLENWHRGCERKIFYDNHETIHEKLNFFIGRHNLAGVFIQDFSEDLLWLNWRSVFGCVRVFMLHWHSTHDVFVPPQQSSETNDILPVQSSVQESPNTASTETPVPNEI